MEITLADLRPIFHEKYGQPPLGPLPRQAARFGYFFPDEFYEAIVDRLVTPGCRWMDVGGGREIFPGNANLSRRCAQRCGHLVGVDPDANIHQNPFVHQKVQGYIEDFIADEPYDLITLRMVAEHITQPTAALSAIARALKPGGRLVVYTINKFAPVSMAAWIIPFRLHHPIKKLMWHTEERDTFPVAYQLNTRSALRRECRSHGLKEEQFLYLDDCRTFHGMKWLNLLELVGWRFLRLFGASYPENCLLGVYRLDELVS